MKLDIYWWYFILFYLIYSKYVQGDQGTRDLGLEHHQAKGTKLLLFYLLPTYGTSLALIAIHENALFLISLNLVKAIFPFFGGDIL